MAVHWTLSLAGGSRGLWTLYPLCAVFVLTSTLASSGARRSRPSALFFLCARAGLPVRTATSTSRAPNPSLHRHPHTIHPRPSRTSTSRRQAKTRGLPDRSEHDHALDAPTAIHFRTLARSGTVPFPSVAQPSFPPNACCQTRFFLRPS